MIKLKHKGFTLLEVIVSLGLLVMIIGLLPLIGVVQQNNAFTSNNTNATNIALSLSEMLVNLPFTQLGSDNAGACLGSDGHVVNAKSNVLCKESSLNSLGYTSTEVSSDPVYMFDRYVVVCTNALNLPGGYTAEACGLPSSNFTGGPVPDELKCVSTDYNANSKGVKILVTYRDRKGTCKKVGLQSFKVNFD